MNLDQFIADLNNFTINGRHLGNLLTQKTTFGDVQTVQLNFSGGPATIMVQPTVRASGRAKWIADVCGKKS